MSRDPFERSTGGCLSDSAAMGSTASGEVDDPGGYSSLTFASILMPSAALPATPESTVGPTPQLSPRTSLSSSSPETSFDSRDSVFGPSQVRAWSPGLPSPAPSSTTPGDSVNHDRPALGVFHPPAFDQAKHGGLGASSGLGPAFMPPYEGLRFDGTHPVQPPVFLSTAPDGSLQYFVWTYLPQPPFAPDAPWITHPPSAASTPHNRYPSQSPLLGLPMPLPTGLPHPGPSHSFPGTPVPFNLSPPAGPRLSLPTPVDSVGDCQPWAPHAPHTAPSSPTAPFYPLETTYPAPPLPSQQSVGGVAGWRSQEPVGERAGWLSQSPVDHPHRSTEGGQVWFSFPTGPSAGIRGGRGSQARGRGRGRGWRANTGPNSGSSLHHPSRPDGNAGPRSTHQTVWSMGPSSNDLGFTPGNGPIGQTFGSASIYAPIPAPPAWNDNGRNGKRRGSSGPSRAPRNFSGSGSGALSVGGPLTLSTATGPMPASWPSPRPEAPSQTTIANSGAAPVSTGGDGPPYVGLHHARASGPHPLPHKPSLEFVLEVSGATVQQQPAAEVM